MTILIIEDEIPAQQLLQYYCAQLYPRATILVASSALQAEEYLTGSHIDVAVSDIDLYDGTGVGLAERFARTVPWIFTTAYSEFAVEAFACGAFDYIVKPFSLDRLVVALEKASLKLSTHDLPTIAATMSGRPVTIPLDTVHVVQAWGNYVRLHTKDGIAIADRTLKSILAVPGSPFVQVHKSFLVPERLLLTITDNTLRAADVVIPIGVTFRAVIRQRLHG
ncbi:MAG: LytTR family DNA-binding domain-containing protein [Candidatus Kapabacteria bacterium]|nr:LytTR family DNA-binding domain-containing protein [Candidatus Kapabacteria bacterium]